MSADEPAPRRTRIGEAVARHRQLLGNAASMLGTTVATAGLGVVFWLLAAREFSPDAVGVAGAAVSAMTLLGFVATVGLGTLLMGELPRRRSGAVALINAALVVAGVVGIVIGLGFAVIGPAIASNLDPLSADAASIASFALGAGLTSLALVLDQSLIGLLQGGLQLTRNVAFAVVKLVALAGIAVLVADAGAGWIYSAWALGIAASLLVLGPFYVRRRHERMRPDLAALREMRGSAASHAAVNLGLETADLAMPVLILAFLTASESASFYIAWMVTNILIMVPLSLSMVAYAIGAGDPSRPAERFRFTIRVSLGFGVLATLFLLFAATPLLEIFGESYADDAATSLRIMALAVFPLTIKVHYVAVHRLERRLRAALPFVWAGTVLELAGGVVGAAVGDLSAVAIGWLAGLCIEAAAMARPVIRAVRGDLREPPETEGDRIEALADFDAATVQRR
jgi:O-antigen/teichoic acid export membrane protein